jgi:uncharacterized phage-associated protein
LSLFRLHKLLYLAEVEAREATGRPFVGTYYIRQKDGPFAPEVTRAVKYLCQVCAGAQGVKEGPSYFLRQPHKYGEITVEQVSILESVVRKYGRLSNAAIKIVAYRNGPMREMVEEQRKGKVTYNLPLFASDLPE